MILTWIGKLKNMKEKKRSADRRKIQHGVMPSQPVKTKVSILHMMKHIGPKKELYRALIAFGKLI